MSSSSAAAAAAADEEDISSHSHPLSACWVLHDESLDRLQSQSAGDEATEEEPRRSDAAEVSDPSRYRTVAVRLESTLTGCDVKVELNGVCSSLSKPTFGRHKRLSFKEERFHIVPLEEEEEAEEPEQEAGLDNDGEKQATEEEKHGDEDSTGSGGPPVPDSGDVPEADPSPIPCQLEPLKRPSAGPASFSAVVTLETEEVQAWTAQTLVEPGIVVVEVFDTSVILRLTELTGDRFELTVYASGRSESSSQASTLVRGLVRSSESLQTIDKLESSQVYVAWVRVFCDKQVQESKQKGFKTLAAKEKTIWDEPDHEILGVSPHATAKEITKAFRQMSLLYHPDKENDPEKKDAAEDMMKRLNLAKTNMLRCASTDTTTEGGFNDSPLHTPMRPPSGQPFFSGGDVGSFSDSEYNSDSDASFRGGYQERTESMRTPKQEDAGPAHKEEEPCLRCSLRIQAPRPPKLQVQKREITSLELEATCLPLGGTVEVQRFDRDSWIAACAPVVASSTTMKFIVEDLEEHCQYRFRLKTSLQLDPLRFAFARLARDDEASQAVVVDESESRLQGDEAPMEHEWDGDEEDWEHHVEDEVSQDEAEPEDEDKGGDTYKGSPETKSL
mmetsp:Transcript_7477/g.16517  ORF Transcript_7477/g.16517 Transcript_7477/m.16517 type:complete len:615 (-) Transcript_7477:204-2048(-)